MMFRWRSILLPIAAAVAVGCTSPESTRTRGGGPGADIGNHPRGPIQIHAGAEVYYETPTQGPGIGQRRFIGTASDAEAR
jgi:hypothetical protein